MGTVFISSSLPSPSSYSSSLLLLLSVIYLLALTVESFGSTGTTIIRSSSSYYNNKKGFHYYYRYHNNNNNNNNNLHTLRAITGDKSVPFFVTVAPPTKNKDEGTNNDAMKEVEEEEKKKNTTTDDDTNADAVAAAVDVADVAADADAETTNELVLEQQIDDIVQKTLYRAVETKKEDPDIVIDALLELEKLSRMANKDDPTRSDRTLSALASSSSSLADDEDDAGVSWRLIFTTGTIDTQRKLGGTKINYFPLKAVQSFNNYNNNSNNDEEQERKWSIQNGIYATDEYALIKFLGDFDWTLTTKSGKTKLTFDFDRIQLFNGFFDIALKKGEAASIGSKTGLGSENNVKLINEKGKRPFFDWIYADDQIATARGGGGGLALWKRLP